MRWHLAGSSVIALENGIISGEWYAFDKNGIYKIKAVQYPLGRDHDAVVFASAVRIAAGILKRPYS